MAFPLSWGGKTEVRMATEVAKIIAPPTPWRTLKAISISALGGIAERMEPRLKTSSPTTKTFFLPAMSAILPKGTENMPAARRYAVAIQPRVMASI